MTAVVLLRPWLMMFTKRDWRGIENLRSEVLSDGRQVGIVVAANHISYFDPLECAHYLYDNGRLPRFMGKHEVFELPVIGPIITGAGQIPVYRETEDAANAIRAAIEAVNLGECVVIYPEGTISRDPELWPMTGKTGAARIALMTGAPLIPLAQWGAQEVVRPYAKELRLIPRKVMQVMAGPPVDLDDLRGRPIDAEVLDIATTRLMAAITAQLEILRGAKAPVERYDLKAHQARSPEE
jgi:1-acyl-sn-glycerol-3-phosphate acyltransferase